MRINRENLKNISKKKYLEYQKLFPVLQNTKTKEYSMLILTFLTLIFFAIFAINPTLSTIAKLTRQLEDAKLADEALSQKITNLGILQSKFNSLGDSYTRIIDTLPNKSRAAYLIGQIRTIARDSGVQVGSISTTKIEIATTDQGEELQYFELRFDISGSYSSIDNFLNSFSSFERLVKINSISINKTSVNDNLVNMNINAQAYFMK